MHRWIQGFFLAGVVLLSISCDWTERESPEPMNPRFSPLQVGRFWVYEVEQREYFGEADFEDSHFFYRDQITEELTNAQGQPVYRVVRQRSVDRQQWDNELAYSLRMDESRLVRWMNNSQHILLIYPVQPLRQWDANLFNPTGPEIFAIERIGSHAMGERVFPSAVLVRHMEDDDFITFRDNRYEVYAENVGLVESYSEVFTYCSRSACLGQQIIQAGRFIHLKLSTHGIF
ncbi:hypothetical protein ADIS_2774 [Lunatimonas lonarensis]|uniref:Lipoprotein n=1 Tax=Lunatimonas lonarensis TaxID=1232681 RepID=R7ZRG0_9BACT|nr:hypothetical protein [Lunatimonas lonarensis]EON76715.1 hypothetical protein ADIS_2774 [Lunatimonas lonarensis]